MSEVVRSYYNANAEREWERLDSDAYHKLEFIITMYFLDKYLPNKGLILEAGGGSGRYTIELAKKGYQVVLFDLSPGSLEIAHREIVKAGVKARIKKIIEGSITDMSDFAEESFDAVLCLGTLSHLIDRKDREIAASELIGVTKKKAPIFISVIGLFGVFRTVLQRPQLRQELTNPSHEEMFSQGIHKAEWHKHEATQGQLKAFLMPTSFIQVN